MLESHLQQIALSAEAIADLPFPPPQIFTNALLHPHDITTLIRDTEAHERALFTVAPSEPGSIEPTSTHKNTVFRPDHMNGTEAGSLLDSYGGLRPTVVAGSILGGSVMDRIQRGISMNGRDKTEVDVDFLLKGAKELCDVYPIQGAMEKIVLLRARHEQLTSSIERYEARMAKQAIQLEKINRRGQYNDTEDVESEHNYGGGNLPQDSQVTAEDIQREEEEMKELEKKKRGLVDRVSSMEKDLGGLLR